MLTKERVLFAGVWVLALIPGFHIGALHGLLPGFIIWGILGVMGSCGIAEFIIPKKKWEPNPRKRRPF